jgi:hypothetical protein
MSLFLFPLFRSCGRGAGKDPFTKTCLEVEKTTTTVSDTGNSQPFPLGLLRESVPAPQGVVTAFSGIDAGFPQRYFFNALFHSRKGKGYHEFIT